ncbi:YegS/Rv2252/BmrU family lipid kinase [Gloeocapsopsis dulcis]|uniref:Lipid kinase n=1 Tax=Gloeocapsopsis dulcis AAB1 = 1H9 TaxID=1433147 RepID=A0A6N8FWT1_9CHRO|nr:YegS/Rv2252/BmrU family lipid kinase [Gloeocapsopsis dulcis]MUL37580.1 lipid kinase [Gloeocapsopsis dulcis AAB1 = 1H9]WNN87992.1 YegS/Rv2252/BmrU family lipid kinase [Gloeocapsopsis dulcis]
MSPLAYLIFKPTSEQHETEQELIEIRAILEPEFNLSVYFTTPEDSAGQLAHQAVENGAEVIIASGGDGTVSAAAEALIGTEIPFGVIPRGTANAFATYLGIPNDLKAACLVILSGHTRLVDTALCNGKPMVLLAGIGFEAKTIEQADNEAKKRFGALAYILAGIKQFWQGVKPFETSVETESQTAVIQQATAVTVANSAPPTSVLAHGTTGVFVDDGLLDITITSPQSRLEGAIALYHLLKSGFNNNAVDLDNVHHLRARHIKIKTEPPQPVVLDGNLMGTTPIEIECIPNSLNVFVPSTAET